MQYDGDYKILKKIWYGHAQPVVTYHHRILPAQGHQLYFSSCWCPLNPHPSSTNAELLPPVLYLQYFEFPPPLSFWQLDPRKL